jgi:hypothetical protein
MWWFAPAFASSIDHSLLDATIKRHFNQVRYCYEKRLPQRPDLEGALTVRFRLELDGTITWAEIRDSTLEDPEVEECVRDLFLSWEWPPGHSVYVVSYPLVFTKKPEAGR